MPKVTKTDGTTFTSHWLASPNKYMTPEPAAAFAAAFDIELSREGNIPPCGACHGGKLSRMKDKAIRIQDGIYEDALVVQAALVESLAAIAAAKSALADTSPGAPSVDTVLLDAAADDHRGAHVRWENLVVSENSMGFHNPSEVSGELTTALNLAQSAKQNAEDAIGGGSCTDGDGDGYCDPDDCDDVDPAVNPGAMEICDDTIDNDCDGLIDLDDLIDCPVTVDCSGYLDKGSCNNEPACRWSNKAKECVPQ